MNGSGLIVAPSLQLPAAPSSAAAADLNGDGNPDLVVTSLGSGNVTVLLGDGKGSFTSSLSFPAGQQPGNVVLADVNGDGRIDIVVTDRAAGAVQVLAGRGDGTFGNATAFPAIANPVALAAANISGKGKMDLVVAASTGVAVLLNDGTGHFRAPSNFMLTSQPVALAAADLRGQGHDDILVANQNGALSVLLGDGTGRFQPQPVSAIASGPLSSIAVGDFNRDGKLDLAITGSSTNEATILLGHGNGTFQVGPAYAVGSTPTSILAVDLRGTGIPDLVTVNRGANTFSVLLGNGDGSFRPSLDFIAGNSPIAAVVGNFSGNGRADVVTLNSQSNSVALNAGNGDGTFVAARSYRSGGLDRKSIASGDLNGDGRPDLVVANLCGVDPACSGPGNISVFLGDANGAFTYSGNYPLGSGPVAVALADLKGDHKLALIALNRNDKSMTIMPGNGDGTFGQAQTYSLPGNPRALLAGDLNGDSKVDLAIALDCGQTVCTQPGSLSIFLGRGDGSMAESASYPTGFSPISIASGDLRGSGHSDLVVGNACGEDATCKVQGTALVFANDGTGKLTRGSEISIGNAPSAIALGSLSGSGLDLVVAQSAVNKVAVLHGDGNGGFGAPVAYSVGVAPSSVTLADIRGTGRLDVAVSNLQSSTLSVLFGAGNGSLQPAVTVPVGSGPEAVIATAASKGSPASLVTANGNTGASPAAVDFTVVAHPMAVVNVGSFTLTATPAGPSVVNASVTLSATAAGTAGTPTGTAVFNYSTDAGVTFTALSDCGGPTGLTLDGTGAASCVTQQLPAGSLVLQAQYSGEPTVYNPAPSNQVARTVTAAATTVSLSANPAAPTTDEVITLTATVRPTTAPAVVTDTVAINGTIAFNDTTTATPLCAAAASTFNATTGVATLTCQVGVLSVVTHSLNAVFVSSDVKYTGNTGTLSLPVTAAPTASTVVPTPNTANVDDSVALAITVAPNVTGTLSSTANLVSISGTVTAYDGAGSTAIASCTNLNVTYVPANGNATANCTTTDLTAGSHSITAQFTSTSTDYINSPRGPGAPLTITAAPTTVTLSAVPNYTVGDTVTLTATVKPTSGTTVVVPFAGSITFRDGATAVSGCTPTFNTTTGVASCSTADLPAGGRSITAIYNNTGDSNYAASAASAAQTPTGAKAATTTAVTQIADFTVGATVTLTATISLTDGNPIPPLLGVSGTVTFRTSGNPTAICSTTTISAAGVASCNTTALKAGTYAITATYSGDNNYQTSSNAVAMLFNGTAAATTAHMGAVANFTVDDNVTLTSTLTLNSGNPVPAGVPPTGTVTFLDGGAAIGGNCATPVNISATGTATCSTTTLIHGAHSITATYSGDNTNYAASPASTAVTPTGTAVGTSETVTGPASFAVNSPVTLTATITVAGGRAISVPIGGTATFLDGANTITGCATPVSVNSSGVAICNATALGAGAHNITATYDGDLNYSASPQSAVFTTTGSTTLPTVTVTASAASQVVNTALTFTATIAPPSGSTVAISTSTVDFTYSGGTLCNAVAVNTTTDKATCPYSALPAGTYTITATFSGDNNYKSALGVLTQTVTPGTSTVTIARDGTSVNPSTVNQLVTFNVSVTRNTPPTPAVVPLTGNVTVTDSATGTALVCGAFSAATGTMSCPTQGLALGSHTLTATYSGDASYPGSGTVSQTVNPGTVMLGVSGTSPVVFQTSTTFTASVAPPAGPTGLSGTIEFQDTPQGGVAADIPGCSTVGVNAGKATCTTSSLVLGAHTITVLYNGDKNFNTPAAPATFPVSVTQAGGNTLTITSSSNPAVVNQASAVNFTATLAINTGGSIAGITGTVGFTDNSVPIANCTAQPLSVQPPLPGKTVPTTAIATCADAALTATAHTIAATYTGSSTFGAASGTLSSSESVTAAATSLSLKSNSSIPVGKTNPTSSVNQPVTFTATVTFPSPSGGVPLSGAIEFQDTPSGGVASDIPGCSAQPVSATDGTAGCTTATLALGLNHLITAIYTDSLKNNFKSSNGTTLQDVTSATVVMSLAVAAPGSVSAIVNQAVPLEFDANLTAPTGAANLTGTVTFTDNGNPMLATAPNGLQTPICKQIIPSATGTNANGTTYISKCIASGLMVGNHTIAATFSQDANFANTSATLSKTVAVTAASASLSLASSSAPTNTSQLNASVTFTATLTAPAGGVSPYLTGTTQTGKVNFNDAYIDVHGTAISASISGCSAQAVDPGTSSATCTTPALAEGAHTITASYTDSAGNFTVQSSPSLTQTVSGNATKVTINSVDNSNSQLATNTSSVNDSVTFTAAVTLANQGPVIPSWKGTMTFQVNGLPLICSEAAANGSNVLQVNALSQQTASVTCTTNLLTAPLANITATYANDPNFTGSFGTFQQGVQKVAVAIQLDSSAAGKSVPAFQPGVTNGTAVTFSATIRDKNGKPYSSANQDFVGLDPVKGQVVFTDNLVGHPICTSSLGVLPSGNTGATCTCNSGTNNCTALANGALPDNINAISAQYINDPNTQIGTSVNSVNQPVADYSIGNSSAPPVFVSQGFTTKSDPFTPQNLTITPTSIYDYKTPDGQPLQLTCIVNADPTATIAPVNPPTCTLTSSTLAVATPPNPGDPVAQAFVPLVIDATGTQSNPVTAGVYTVTVTAVDGNHLTRMTQFTMSVRAVNAPIQLTSGTNTTTLSPTPSVTFVLPAGEQVSNFQCLFMAGTGLNGQTGAGAFNTHCQVNQNTVLGDANSTQPQTVTLNFEIDTGVSSTAAIDRHTTLLVAGVLGLPLFGLLGLIRGRRSLKSVFLSLFALLALYGSVLQMSGCGGSFTSTTTTTSHGTTPPGTYYFRIQGTGTSGQHAQYEAVVVVEVHL